MRWRRGRPRTGSPARSFATERAAIVVPVDRPADATQLRPQCSRRFWINVTSLDDHSILGPCRLSADLAVEHVIEHARRVPLEWIAVTATSRGPNVEHIAGPHLELQL